MGEWNGRDRRRNHRLRELLDHLNDRVLQNSRELAWLGAQITQMRSEMDELKNASRKESVGQRAAGRRSKTIDTHGQSH